MCTTMLPKQLRKHTNNPKPILIKSSRVVSRADEREGGEETEIAAQISIPHDGGWGWVVVFSAFVNIFILDGVAYTFGSLLPDIVKDLKVSESLVALINSMAVALYFVASPLASALINRFGFRECAMTGSVICSLSLFSSYFTTKYPFLCILYGIFTGFGFSLINMASGLVVGFYFEKLRSLAMSITTCGSSFGVMTLFPLNLHLVELGGWRNTTLLHSGLFGIIFFSAMSFRPLISLTVTKTGPDPARTVTYLPSLTSAQIRQTSSNAKAEVLVPTTTERLFSAVSNVNFPTAAAVVDEGNIIATGQPGPSTARSISKLTLTAASGISHRQMKRVQSIISRTSEQPEKPNIELNIKVEPPKKRSCWQRLLHWESHVEQARPMYRDDAFYDGKLSSLPEYQKSTTDTAAEVKTGLEYQLAVSRALTVDDLKERKGVFTTAIRRVLATMMDPKLLKKCSFLLMCMSGFLTYLGFLVPYVYLQDRNKKAGIPPEHCTFFISAIGLSNAIGRLVLGSLASKIDPLYLFSLSCTIAGISTIASGLSYSLYYQYLYCCIFGFTIASVACLRSIILVSLYGLDRLTNATGMMLIFLGIGNLISTPVAGIIKSNFGYGVAFYVAGTFITLSGLILIPVKAISKRENKKNLDPNKEISKREVKKSGDNKDMSQREVKKSVVPKKEISKRGDKKDVIGNPLTSKDPIKPPST